MPTEKQLLDAKAKREARAAARAGHAEDALRQQHALALQSEEQAVAKREGTFTPPVKPAANITRAASIKAKRRAAEVQAAKDATLVPEEVEVEKFLGENAYGNTPPLHVLNAIASKADAAIRDEARQIANAAGKAAFDLAVGRRGRHDTVNRHRRMRDQMAAADAAKVKK